MENIPTESQEQVSLFAWADVAKSTTPELEWLFHVPNGGARHPVAAARLKLEGVKAGVPDLLLLVPRGGFHGLAVELKRRKGGYASAEQKKWLQALTAAGYKAVVCKGWEDARDTIMEYLRLEQK